MVYKAEGNKFAWAPAVENLIKSTRDVGIDGYTDFLVENSYDSDLAVRISNGGLANFDGSTFSWANVNWINDFVFTPETQSAVSLDTVTYHSSPNSLKWDYTDDGATQYDNRITMDINSSLKDWSKKNIIRFYFYPAATLENTIYLSLTNNGTEYAIGSILPGDVTPSTWNVIEFDLPTYRDQVEDIFFYVDGNQWTTATHTFYIDDIYVYKKFDIVAPTTADYGRIDLIYIDSTGEAQVKTGTEVDLNTDTPKPEDLDLNELGLALISVQYGDTVFTSDDIVDIRVPLKPSTEINDNGTAALIAACDNALLSTTTIDVMNLVDSQFKIVDLFTDTTGEKDTVNTTNTTALYNSVNTTYESNVSSSLSTIVGEPSFETITGWVYTENDNSNRYTGEQSTDWATESTHSYKLQYVISSSHGTAGNNAKITRSVDFTNIGILAFDYKVSTTGSDGQQSLQAKIDSTTMWTIVDSSVDLIGTAYINCSNITGVHDLSFSSNNSTYGTISCTNKFYVDNIRTLSINSIIESEDIDVGLGYNYTMVRPKLYEAIPTGADITCYISLDGGSTWSLESNINEVVDIRNLTDTGHLIIKLNLNTDGTVTSKVSGWACLLFK